MIDDQQAAAQLAAVQRTWDKRAPLWNERNLQNWNTADTQAWWAGWFGNLCAFLADPPGPLLDAGCGNGQISVLFAREGYAVKGCDLSSQMVAFAQENTAKVSLPNPPRYEVASIDALPYADGEFAVVNCRCVLDFAPRPAYALRELRRVTRPGGVLILNMMGAASPIKRNYWLRHLQGIDPAGDQFTDILNGITPWEMDRLMPVIGWRRLHQEGNYGDTAVGAVNQFASDEMIGLATLFQQAAATNWLIVADAVEPVAADLVV